MSAGGVRLIVPPGSRRSCRCQSQAFEHGQDSLHVPVGQGCFDFEVLARFDVLFAGKIAADQLDAIIGQMRKIGNGFFFDFAVFSVGVHEQMGHVLAVRSLTPGRHYMYGTMW